jgi:uncharacterized protein (TIGR00255 family)
MIHSMTGFGRSQATIGENRMEVELRSINHKFCEISVKLPKPLSSLENQVKKHLQQRFARGRLDLSVTLNGSEEQDRRLQMDLDMARQYRRLLLQLKNRLSLKGDVDLALLTNFRNIITVAEKPSANKRLAQSFFRLLDLAEKRLERMRRKEGRALAGDLLRRLRRIRNAVKVIRKRAPMVVTHYQQQLRSRVRRLTEGIPLDERRMEQEVALFATRCDISEELTRLESHLSQFDGLLRKPASIGRSLDFLIQEMHREVNTSGSKANDVTISRQVILIKSELEKVREQVQNVE